MSGFLIRRSLPAMGALLGLLFLGGAFMVGLGAPLWLPFVVSVFVVGLQWAIAPRVIEWLVPARIAPRAAGGYDIDHALGRIVERRCEEAGLGLVRLGVVDDGTPNAFTFGHTRGDARIWVTSGLLERLDEDELDAVVSHEIGHVANNDFVVMTVAALVPIVLYYTFLASRREVRKDTLPLVVTTYVAYLVSELVLLALSRSRELAADHHSCRVTGNGDALSSALVKIAYGMGQVKADRAEERRRLQAELDAQKGKAKREASKRLTAARRRENRINSLRVMGIADPSHGEAVMVARQHGLDPEHVLGGLRWDACNPWARFQEKLSSHPIVVHRIAALERSGLPGAPKEWAAVRTAASCRGEDLAAARRRFPGELVARYAGPLAVVVGALAIMTSSWALLAGAVFAAGTFLLVRAALQYPKRGHTPVEEVASLLTRLDASPITGLAVSLRGRVVGRGMPGYVLSPDLVIQDESGFVPILYRQPVPLARELFGLLKAGAYRDQEVLVRGWYRRMPAPVVELRDVVAADGARSRAWWWVACYVLSGLLLVTGAVAVLVVTVAG